MGTTHRRKQWVSQCGGRQCYSSPPDFDHLRREKRQNLVPKYTKIQFFSGLAAPSPRTPPLLSALRASLLPPHFLNRGYAYGTTRHLLFQTTVHSHRFMTLVNKNANNIKNIWENTQNAKCKHPPMQNTLCSCWYIGLLKNKPTNFITLLILTSRNTVLTDRQNAFTGILTVKICLLNIPTS